MVNKYTQEELDFIRNNYKTMTYEEIGKQIGRSKSSIQEKVARLGLRKNNGSIGFEQIKLNSDQEPEIWKDVKGYEGRYKVSNYGRILSVERKDRTGYKRNEKILIPDVGAKGYKRVRLSINMKNIQESVHVLVAQAFVENPNNYPLVNHKDENPANNFYKNLEWCSYQYNLNYGSHNEKVGRTKGREVLQYDMCGNLVGEYYSVGDASKQTGINYSGILRCCGGRRKRIDGTSKLDYMGFIWKYKDKTKKSVRPVIQYDLDMNEINRFDSSMDAARALGVKCYGIKDCCKGLLKTSHGYIWRYQYEI